MANYSSSRDLSEREKSYDKEVQDRELKNKQSLIRDGVPVSYFDSPGCDVIHREKLKLNTRLITKDVRFEYIRDHLIQDNILQAEHVERLESYMINHNIMSKLLMQHMSGREAYRSFRQALRSEKYDHVVKALDDTEVNKAHIEFPRGAGRISPYQSETSFTEIKGQEKTIQYLINTVQVLSEKITELTDQNIWYKDSINQLKRSMRDNLEGPVKQVSNEVSNDMKNLFRVVERLKLSQHGQQEMTARMRTEQEEDSTLVKTMIDEGAASVEEMVRREPTETSKILMFSKCWVFQF